MSLFPITKPVARPRVKVYDLEWHPDSMKLRLAGLFDGENYQCFYGIPGLMRAMFSRENRGVWFFAHFGGAADIAFLQAWFLKNTDYQVELRFSGSAVVVAEVSRGKDRWFLVDSYFLMRDSLKNIAPSVGMKKGECSFTAPLAELQAYNEQDCRILYKAITSFQAELEALGGELRPTIASCAMALYKRRFLKSPVRTADHLNNVFREAYIASRVEVFARHLTGGANHYDVNSSFPSSLMGDVPGGPVAFNRTMPRHDCFMAECTVDVKPQYLPPLPYRVNDRVFFPVGTWKAWLSGPDVRFAEETGSLAKVHSVWTFEPRKEPGEYVETIFALKAAAQDPFKVLVYKYLLNALYGKFGEGAARQTLWINPLASMHSVEGAVMLRPGVWLVTSHHHATHEHVALAAHVTAKSRALLTRYLYQAGRVYYCDTDSIVTKAELPTSPRLGDLKALPQIQEGYFAAPKFYMIDDVVKAKGFPTLGKADFLRLVAGGGQEVQRMARVREMHRDNAPEPSKLTYSKHARLTVDKRRFDSTGESEPYSVTELYAVAAELRRLTGTRSPVACTHMNITELREKFARAKSAMGKVREKADNVFNKSLAAAEVGLAAGAIGLAEGYTGGDIKVAGVPAEWLGAAVGHGYAFMSGTSNADHAHNLANGCLAVGAYKGGKSMGKKAKENKDKTGSVFGEEEKKRQQMGSGDNVQRGYGQPQQQPQTVLAPKGRGQSRTRTHVELRDWCRRDERG